ncbi:uncharacterized protein LOC143361363 [Halictus rubicundus]|uniref:uncharacterized protein LOC143361363 n=1 Tax=Halictus rubicundus TaxID=77578 RepID=UPI0040352A03
MSTDKINNTDKIDKMGAGSANVERIRGDGLSLKLPSNERILEVVGDGCSIILAGNSGTVRIIGDGCRLRIDSNIGDVEYVGDGGRVLLGAKSLKSRVKYVGDGGKVSVDGDKRRSKKVDHVAKEKIGKNSDEGSKETISGSSKTAEEEDNNLNTKKEARSAGSKKDEHVVKIVTMLHCDQKVVTRWFVDPGSVVRSFDGKFVKVETKRKEKSKGER